MTVSHASPYSVFWFQHSQVRILYFGFSTARSVFCILVSAQPGQNSVFWFQHRQVRILYFGFSTARSVFCILVSAQPGPYSVFWFQHSQVRILHLESRKSRHRESEYDIFADLDLNGITVNDVTKNLKPKVGSIYIQEKPKGMGSMGKTISLDKGDTKCKRILLIFFTLDLRRNNT